MPADPGRPRWCAHPDRGSSRNGLDRMGGGGLGLGYRTPVPKSTTLDDVAKRPREYPRPAKVESVATEQEPHAGMAGAFFVGGSTRLRLPHTYPLPDERSGSPSSRCAPWGRTGAAEDRAVPGNM